MTISVSTSRAVSILGMHRSGTSVAAKAVNILGAYLGEEADLMPLTPENPEGFYERNDVFDVHTRMLLCLKRTWDTPLPLPDGWHLSEEMRPFKEEISGIVRKNFSGQKLWAWKDPRTSLLLEVWKEVLAQIGIGLKCLIIVRNPLDCARSLEKRNRMPLDKAFGVWFNYNINALRSSSGVKRIFVSYDRFLDGWETEIERCAQGLQIPWPAADTPLKQGMTSFLRPELRHNLSTTDDLIASGAPGPVIELYGLLLKAVDSGEMPPFMKRADELYRDFFSYAAFFRDGMESLLKTKQRLKEAERQLKQDRRGNSIFRAIWKKR